MLHLTLFSFLLLSVSFVPPSYAHLILYLQITFHLRTLSQSTIGDLPHVFRNYTIQLVSMTSSTLVLTIDIDAFQHGDEPLTPKCLAVACNHVEGSYSWLFDISHLLTCPTANIHTYHYQMDIIHGLPLSLAGLPCDLF